MKTPVDENTEALLIWGVEIRNGNELIPLNFFGAVGVKPYAETARYAMRCARPHVLTRGLQEFLAVFDREGESCSNSVSAAEFMVRARAYVASCQGAG